TPLRGSISAKSPLCSPFHEPADTTCCHSSAAGMRYSAQRVHAAPQRKKSILDSLLQAGPAHYLPGGQRSSHLPKPCGLTGGLPRMEVKMSSSFIAFKISLVLSP